MKRNISHKHIHTLSFAALIFALTGNPLMAGKTTLPREEAADAESPRAQRHVQAELAPEQDASSHSPQIPTLADISPEQPLVHQLAQFTLLTTSLTDTTPLPDDSRTQLKGIQAELETRIQRSSGVVPYNTAWVFLNSHGRRLEQKFLTARHQYYTARSLRAQEEEKSSRHIDENTPLRSEYFTALAEAYGPKRAQRLLAEAPTDFEPAGIGYRYISLKDPRVLFPSSDPELAPIWDQAKVVLHSIYRALGEDFSPDKRGPIFLKAPEGGFPYSDEDLQTYESFTQTYAITPPARRFPVQPIGNNAEPTLEEQTHPTPPANGKQEAALAPETGAAKSPPTTGQASMLGSLSHEQTQPEAGAIHKAPPSTALEATSVILAPGANQSAPASGLAPKIETSQTQYRAESIIPWFLKNGLGTDTTLSASAPSLTPSASTSVGPAAQGDSSPSVEALGSTTLPKQTQRASRKASTHTGRIVSTHTPLESTTGGPSNPTS